MRRIEGAAMVEASTLSPNVTENKIVTYCVQWTSSIAFAAFGLRIIYQQEQWWVFLQFLSEAIGQVSEVPSFVTSAVISVKRPKLIQIKF